MEHALCLMAFSRMTLSCSLDIEILLNGDGQGFRRNNNEQRIIDLDLDQFIGELAFLPDQQIKA
jgi:hypothetical protein